ncbi:hypothetical protein [Synechococcus phage S-B64]|uniref:Uncharacterized protein n=2 Tax=Shandvirus TaxID=2948904 RepID=A0A1Z1LWM8_9CAUD|nr:hypothetical protein KNT63_gp184 [Synechococcus phage S-H35]YP_010095258.1 hypothetical protein KNT88_gp020 [Synechococcus phage S-B64]ARW57064.1 hypothetical protein [Synechococcus phage S-H35]AWD90056.1 hypothetical protein [Synechococcus phage S-B64]
MAQHHIVDWLGVITLFLFGITMICQGHFIVTGKHGYKHAERENKKMIDARKQVEDLFKK